MERPMTPPAVEPAPHAVSPAAEQPASPAPRIPDPAEIERTLRESGLEMVRTRSDIRTEPGHEPEFVPAKRERRPPPPDVREPLIQVETARDASTPKD